MLSEHAFGLTKGWWRVLLKRPDEDKERIPDTIMACCILHNICILQGDDSVIDVDDDSDSDCESDDDGAPCQDADDVMGAIVQHVATH